MKLNSPLLLVAAICVIFTSAVTAHDQLEPRMITVTGDADVRVAPDEVILTLGVETWSEDLGIAKSTNDQRVKKILAAAKRFGIEQKHIKTGYINIEPRYKDQWEHRKFVGYFVTKKVEITLRDMSKFEALLSGALQAGANYVHGIHFRTTELRKLKDQARGLAIKAAREKAEDLAGALGQKVGWPHRVEEGSTGWRSFGGGRMAQNVIQDLGGASAGEGSFAPGQITVNASVTVSFALE
jgi:uncharacterized protein YggE